LVRILEFQARRKNLPLRSTIHPEVPGRIRGDEVRLRQILVNLVGNAIKFTQQGEISVAVEPGEGCLHFVVADTGIGIPAEKQKIVFAPFEQADSSTTRRYGGTGLGLAIAARLVHLMGGRIWVESPWRHPDSGAEIAGSAFHFTAIFAGVRARECPVAPATAVPQGTDDTRPLKILVAEDNAVNLLLVQRLLEKRGHTVLTAGDGQQVLAILERQLVDLVLMDVQMPIMDGLEATAEIRRHETTAHLPVIALTAHAMSGDRKRCLAAGMDAYITKPIQPEQLYRITAQFGAKPAQAARASASPSQSAR
jgi:CheY-like chemotaxis protein